MSLPDEVVRDVLRAANGSRPPGPCPDADVLALYAEHALDAGERSGVEAHVAACGRCQESLAAFVRSAPEAATVGADAAGVAMPWWQGWRWLVPMAATAAVIVVAVWVGQGPSREVDRMAGRSTSPVAEAPVASSAPAPRAPAASGSASLDAREVPAPQAMQEGARSARAAAESRAKTAQLQRQVLEDKATAGGVATGTIAKAERPAERARDADAPREQVAARADEPRAVPPPPATVAAAAPPPPPPAAVAPPPAPAPATAAGGVTPTFRAAVPERRTEETLTVTKQVDAVEPGLSGAALDRFAAPATWRLREGQVEHTPDNGRTWQAVRLPDGFRPAALSSPSPLVCWVIGPQGAARTIDGRTWVRITVPSAEPLRTIVATDAEAATVTTASGARIATTDGGRTWR